MNARSKDIVPASMSVTERAAQALSREDTEAEIKALVQQSKPIVSVTDNASREVCHSSLMTLRNMRILIERKGKAGRAEAVEYSKTVIAIEKELIGLLSPEEQRLADLRDAYDAEKEREKELRIAAELARQKALRERIVELHGCPTLTPTSGSELIQVHYRDLQAIPLDDSWEEFLEQAQSAKAAGLKRLQDLYAAALSHESAQKRLEDERAELARLQAEEAERQRIAAEERRKQEAIDKAARAQAEAEAKALREAEERKLADERAALKLQEEEAHKRQVEAARAHAQQLAADRAKADQEAEETRARLADETGKLAAAREAFEREQAAHAEALRKAEEPEPAQVVCDWHEVTIDDDAPTVTAPTIAEVVTVPPIPAIKRYTAAEIHDLFKTDSIYGAEEFVRADDYQAAEALLLEARGYAQSFYPQSDDEEQERDSLVARIDEMFPYPPATTPSPTCDKGAYCSRALGHDGDCDELPF